MKALLFSSLLALFSAEPLLADGHFAPGDRPNTTAPVLSKKIREIEFAFYTGTDDLRAGQVANILVELNDGTIYPFVDINNRQVWGEYDRRTVSYWMPKAFDFDQLRSITIVHAYWLGDFNFFESEDNWSVESVDVRYNSEQGSTAQHFGPFRLTREQNNKPFFVHTYGTSHYLNVPPAW